VNRLANETSPYLLQHADNPVDWFAWGDEAFERARAEDRPILLSIGYAACHWCHVMAHESFEDPEIAAVMNELFVCVKVDREERPDVDAVYMDAVVALTGQGGWPMTVFLTPEGEPFLGGTYFPPESRHGLPAFREVLVAVSDAYRERHGTVVAQARQLTDSIRSSARIAASSEPLTDGLLAEAQRALRNGFDPVNGGWGTAPKFPPASVLEFLLRRGETELTAKTLDGMAQGGMWDVVGGGFHRYSVDARWLVPHFEKMLYDNALLAPAYLHGWLVTGDERYREVAERTLDYLVRELRLPSGGFASSQDADTNGVEGLTYTWERGEVPGEYVEPFEDRFIVRGEVPKELRDELLARRATRPQPGLDDKAITSWNGLALAALAEGGRRLERDDLLAAARDLAAFLDRDPPTRLATGGPAFLDDYANVAHGLYELHVATGDVAYLRRAHALASEAVERFADDEHGGFFMTPHDGEQLVARKKELEDHPLPSGNAMLAYVLLRLARIYGDDDFERRGVGVLRLLVNGFRVAPSAFGWALCALDLHLAPPRELALIARPDDELARRALEPWQPNAVVAFGPAEDVPLLAGRDRVDGKPTLYECERFACRAPVTELLANAGQRDGGDHA
jgi:uncharacterized protein